MTDRTERCGRCAMSTVVDATDGGDGDGGGRAADRDPFGGSRIEVDEASLRLLSPAAWTAGIRRRLDRAATRLIRGDSRRDGRAGR